MTERSDITAPIVAPYLLPHPSHFVPMPMLSELEDTGHFGTLSRGKYKASQHPAKMKALKRSSTVVDLNIYKRAKDGHTVQLEQPLHLLKAVLMT